MAPDSTAGVRIASVAGIAIHLDWSVLVIFVLLVTSLGLGWLPHAHHDWSLLTVWLTAIAAGVLFLASILAHELSHAIVGRSLGIPVRRITLFIFGGMAEMEAEPERPSAELGMAIVGPLTSLLIGVVATGLGIALAGDSFAAAAESDTQAALRMIGPVASLFLWLGPVNVFLGIFNMIPGFPLDGGRVLRAILWAATGDLQTATRWATGVGRAFGWALMALGVVMTFGVYVPFFGGGLGGGIWLVMIGWFLSNAARASYLHSSVSHDHRATA